jgi:hypothetical protein
MRSGLVPALARSYTRIVREQNLTRDIAARTVFRASLQLEASSYEIATEVQEKYEDLRK